MKLSKNFIINLITLALSAFVFSGLDIDPTMTAEEIYQAIVSDNWFIMLGIVLLNLANMFIHWINQLRKDPSSFWGFLRSTNWWTGVASVIFMWLTMTQGIQIPEGTAEVIVMSIEDRNWYNLISVVLINVVNPIIHLLVGKDGKLKPLLPAPTVAAA